MRLNKTALLAVVATTLLSSAVYADGQRGRQGPDRGFDGPGFGLPTPMMRIERMAEHLDLDDVQYEQLENIMAAAKPELKALREQLRANKKALRDLDANDPEVQTIAISNGELATEGTLLATRIRGEINAVLTDEQRARLDEGKERRKKERFERRQDRR
jgi:Spy/CpxP family protein refolding chaperone